MSTGDSTLIQLFTSGLAADCICDYCKKTSQFTMRFKDDICHLAGLKQQI